MVASLLKIVSTGIQDERLQPPKGQPDLGSFLTVIVKSGRYATNWTRIDFDTRPDFGRSSVIRLPTKGEMIGRIYLVTQMPDIKTAQLKAYYARKPIKLAPYYTSKNLYAGNGTYLDSITFTYPQNGVALTYPAGDLGLASFTGVQLDDLVIDGTYTLSVSVPTNTNSVFSMALTDKALGLAQFNQLNTDTFSLIGTVMVDTTTPFLRYTYNATNKWQDISMPAGIVVGDQDTSTRTITIQFNGSEYMGVGIYNKPIGSFIIENNLSLATTQPSTVENTVAKAMAFNGTNYLMVGIWDPSTNCQISYSVDGLNWSVPISPPISPGSFISESVANSVVWNSGISPPKWFVVGGWAKSNAGIITGAGIITTSTDITGATEWTTPIYPSVTPPIIIDLKSKSQLASTSLSQFITDYTAWKNTLSSASGSAIYNAIQPIVTNLNTLSLAYNTLIKLPLSTPNTANLNTSSFLNIMPPLSNTIITDINALISLLTSFRPNANILISQYIIVVNNIESMITIIDSIASLASTLATSLSNITDKINGPGDYTIAKVSGYIGQVESGLITYNNYLTGIIGSINLFKTGATTLCTAITTALSLDPTGSQLTGKITTITNPTNPWYPVNLAYTDPTSRSDTFGAYTISIFTNKYNLDTAPTISLDNQLIALGSISTSIGTIITGINTYNTTQKNIISGIAYSIAANSQGQIVIGGYFILGDNSRGTLIYSADGGTTWIGTVNPGGVSFNSIDNALATAVAWSGSLWVAAGIWGNSTISISSDGIIWETAFNPLISFPTYDNSTGLFLPALSIAINPGVGIVVGGNWQNFRYNTVGSFSIAPATSLTFNWPTPNLIRPTPIFTDTVIATGLVVHVISKFSPRLHILLGRWLSNGTQYGAISTSTDTVTWSEAILPHEITYTNTTLYSIAIDSTSVPTPAEYITVAVGSIGNNTQQIGTMSVCNNQLQTKSAADWGAPFFPEGQTSGIGYNIIFNGGLSKYIVVGTWTNGGFITASSDQAGTSYIAPYKKSGAYTQIGRFILYVSSILSNTEIFTYMVVGQFNTRSLILLDIYNDGDDNPIIEATGDAFGPLGVGYGAVFNNLIYVLVGDFTGGSISYSTDGVNWSNPFHPSGATSGYGTSVTWNGTHFIATGSWNTGTISYSRDGQIWESAVNPPDASTDQTNAVAVGSIFNGTTWVAAGNWQTSTLGANVALFTYGIVFGETVNPSGATIIQNTPRSVVWNPNKNEWIAAGKWSYGTQINTGYITRSPDGITWSTPSTISGVSDEIVNQIYIAPNKNIYMVGTITNIPYSLIASSDGLNWTPRQFLNNMAGYINGIVWSGTMWVAVSYTGFSIAAWGQNKSGPIITSTDGINWSDPILPAMPNTPSIQAYITSPDVVASGYTYTVKLNSVAWSGTLWVAVGQALIITPTATRTIAYIVTSPNAVIWTVRTTEDIVYENNGIYGRSVAWNGSIWLAIGDFPDDIYVITSPNGINWNTRIDIPYLLQGPDIGAVAWNGYFWVAVGIWPSSDTNDYPIITSPDGLTWTPRRLVYDISKYSNPSLFYISWNGSLWIATGFIVNSLDPDSEDSINMVATSVDSITWTMNTNVQPGQFFLTAPSSRRILPYTKPQSFDPSLQVDSFPQANQTDFVLKWVRNANYGTGTEYFSRLSNTNQPTYTFTATARTQWLTFGTYYNSAPVVTITLTKVSPTNPKFYTDLVGPYFGWTNSLGHSLIDSASIRIGGNLVETINGQLMEILDEFQTPLEKVSEVSKLICRSESGFTQTTYGFSNATSQKVITPLPFWFSRGDPGCVLPIDALNVDEVRLTVNFKPVTSLYYTDSRADTPVINVEGGSLWPMANSRFYYDDPDSTVVMTNMEPSRVYPNAPISPFAPDIVMPRTFTIPESYLLVEYIYLDKAEANRFRIADLQVPVVQHYILNPQDTNKNLYTNIPLSIPNPTRDIFFYCQRYEAPSLNAHFLATRDISINQADPYSLWWPDATGLDARYPGTLKPGFSSSGSEPIRWLALNYNETLNRYSSENVALFRSFLPSIEQRKAPWINRYYYNLPFGLNNGINPFSMPLGQANLDKIQRVNLSLGFHGITGDPTDNYAERFWVRTYAETYNVFRVYGGRGTMMFAY